MRDETFYAGCHHFSDCCVNLTVASAGLAGSLFPALLGSDHRIINNRIENYGAYIVFISK